MADFTALKTSIRDAIKQNGNEEITGVVLQEILLSMVSTLGEDAINALSAALTAAITSLTNDIGDVSGAMQSAVADLNHSINTEAQTRAYQDQQLQNGINAEGAARQAAISELTHNLNVEAQARAYGDLNEASIRQNEDNRLELRINGLSIDFDDLLEDVRRLVRNYEPIVINGNVTNAPDEQDLTTTPNNLLKFKDNSYNPIVFSGMGKKFLRKNLRLLSESYDFDGFVDDVTTQAELSDYPELIFWDRINEHFVGLKNGVYYLAWADDDAYVPVSTSNVYMYDGNPYKWNGTDFYVDDEELPNIRNLLTQDMINEANTIYIIRYDYTLKENITIPANCILEFDGGSISGNGTDKDTITGNNTSIEAGLVKIFNTNITFAGSWNVAEAYSEWFGAKGDDNTDCTDAINSAINLISLSGGNIKFNTGTYCTNGNHIISPINKNVTIKGADCLSTGVKIKHIGTGFIFKHIRTGNESMLNGGGFKGIMFIGNDNTEYGVRLSDKWCLQIIDCYFSGFKTGIAIDVYNDIGWTENVTINNVMIRGTKIGVKFHKSENPQSTVSFKSSRLDNVFMSFTIGGSRLIMLDNANCYDAFWTNLCNWFESGGGNTVVDVTNNSLITGTAYIDTDGDGNQAIVEDLNLVQIDSTSRIDLVGRCTLDQKGNIDEKNHAGRKFRRIIKQKITYDNYNSVFPRSRFTGASIQFGGNIEESLPVGSEIYDSGILIPFGIFKLELYCRTSNTSYIPYIYKIYCGSTNFAVFIHSDLDLNDAKFSSNNPLEVVPYIGEQGTYQQNKGCRFLIKTKLGTFARQWYGILTQL